VQLTSGGGSMSVIKGGPNPNAAKVFINWFLSRRGQLALQKYNDLYGEDAPNSRRIDIPKDMLVPVMHRMMMRVVHGITFSLIRDKSSGKPGTTLDFYRKYFLARKAICKCSIDRHRRG